MATEAKVAGHYTRGQLEETILRAMAQMGKDTAHLVAADLAPIDEFPVPWARSEETSFVSYVSDYRKMLEEAGFRVVQERNRREFAIEFMNRTMPRMTASGPPVLGVQLLMGDKIRPDKC
jgi:hypothetical protein